MVYVIEICGVCMFPWKRWMKVEQGREVRTLVEISNFCPKFASDLIFRNFQVGYMDQNQIKIKHHMIVHELRKTILRERRG